MTDRKFIEIIRNWKKTHGGLRAGQWLWNGLNMGGHIEAPDGNALFFIEDNDLADLLKKYYLDD